VLLTPNGMSTKLGHGGVANELIYHLAPVDQLQQFDHLHLASVSLPLLEKVLRMKHDTQPDVSSSSDALHSSSDQPSRFVAPHAAPPPSPSLIAFLPSPSPSADSIESLHSLHGSGSGILTLSSSSFFLPHVRPFSDPTSAAGASTASQCSAVAVTRTIIPAVASTPAPSLSASSSSSHSTSSLASPRRPSFPSLSIDLGASILSEDPLRLRDAFRRLDCVFFNEHSLKLVYGIDADGHELCAAAADGDGDESWVAALQRELSGTAAKYVVTLGLHGAHAISAHSRCFRPSVMTPVVDTTGTSLGGRLPIWLAGRRVW
jgi:hypothetical protein